MEYRFGASGAGNSYGRHSWMAGERGSERMPNHACDGVLGKADPPRPHLPRTDHADADKDKLISSLQAQVEEQVSVLVLNFQPFVVAY